MIEYSKIASAKRLPVDRGTQTDPSNKDQTQLKSKILKLTVTAFNASVKNIIPDLHQLLDENQLQSNDIRMNLHNSCITFEQLTALLNLCESLEISNKITEISFFSENITKIPPEIGNLNALTHLKLSCKRSNLYTF